MASHTIMPKKLAQALMDAGMTHLDLGGLFGAGNSYHQDTPAITTQEGLPGQISQLQGQSGDLYGQQQSLANTLLAQSQGQGPNVAQDQLNQTTGQNVQNQAALMAGQRGAGANVGLMARQAAQQGANTQQQAVGQAATLGAQQQLASQNQLQTLQNNLANQNLQNQSIQQGALAAQNSTSTTGQLGAGQINAGASAGNASTSGGIAGGLLGGGASVLGSMLYKGGQVKKFAAGGPVNDNVGIANFATAGGQSMGGGTNSGQTSQGGGSSMGSGINGLGNVGSKLLKGNGDAAGTQSDDSALEGYLDADSSLGVAGVDNPETMLDAVGGGADGFGGEVGDFFGSMPEAFGDAFGGWGGEAVAGIGDAGASGGALDAIGSGAEVAGPALATDVAVAARGGRIPKIPANVKFSAALLNGGNVPGKAQVKGNSPKNDTQPTLLSPGEIVLPRSVTQSPDMQKKAIEFLKHLKTKKGGGYAKVASARG